MDGDDDVGVVDERGACTTVAMANRFGYLFSGWPWWLNDDEKGKESLDGTGRGKEGGA
jgi:hypothetical protein